MRKATILTFLMIVIVGTGFSMGKTPFGMGPGDASIGTDEFFWIADFSDPEARKLLDKYREKMEDIYLESRKERNALQNQRRDLYFKLNELSEKYKSDKSAGSEIVKTLREIYNVTEKLQSINQKTMDKLKKLNEERQKEFSEYTKKWLGSLEKDEAKLSNFIEKLEEFKVNLPPQRRGYPKRQIPPRW